MRAATRRSGVRSTSAAAAVATLGALAACNALIGLDTADGANGGAGGASSSAVSSSARASAKASSIAAATDISATNASVASTATSSSSAGGSPAESSAMSASSSVDSSSSSSAASSSSSSSSGLAECVGDSAVICCSGGVACPAPADECCVQTAEPHETSCAPNGCDLSVQVGVECDESSDCMTGEACIVYASGSTINVWKCLATPMGCNPPSCYEVCIVNGAPCSLGGNCVAPAAPPIGDGVHGACQ